MRVIVEEAHKAGRKVAAHANTAEGIRNAINAGVDSIEHGHGADRQDREMMKAKGVYWVPTVGGEDAFAAENGRLAPEQRRRFEAYLAGIQQAITQGQALGVKIATGSTRVRREPRQKCRRTCGPDETRNLTSRCDSGRNDYGCRAAGMARPNRRR